MAKLTPSQFIDKYSCAVILACVYTKLFPSVKMAQMALETGWGEAPISNNMFGIKATGKITPYWSGSVTESKTSEVVNGTTVKITDGFRAYQSVADSIADHTYLLMNNSRYAAVFEATTPEAQAQAIQAAGYATDPAYASKLIAIINKYNLKQLDQKKKL